MLWRIGKVRPHYRVFSIERRKSFREKIRVYFGLALLCPVIGQRNCAVLVCSDWLE